MSIACEFIDLIIPISNIDKVYKGGFNQFKEDHIELFGGRYRHDDFLFRDGAMNSIDIQLSIEKWEKLGLVGIVEIEGQKKWKDFCVVERMFGGLTLQCDWIEFDLEYKLVRYRNSLE